MDDSAGYAILEAIREINAEERDARRRILAALVHRSKQGPRLVVDNAPKAA
jgi:hypothetical protein